ncbi:MAG TPA: zinc ribbon domain-containing protein [Chthonomonadaceae bacterium]|nr:zinc ribbon domain-containing protein [Chthonomonadaceae bacterium]
MPIYEFVCAQCKRRFRKLVGVVAQSEPLQCPRCQSTQLNRQISRFARVRSEDEALDSLADEMESMGDTDDPKALRRLMREMGKEMGEDLGDEFEQMMEEEAAGEGAGEGGAEEDAAAE